MNTTKTQHKIIKTLAIRKAGDLIAVKIASMPKDALRGLEQDCELCALYCIEDGCLRNRKQNAAELGCSDLIVWRKKDGSRDGRA